MRAVAIGMGKQRVERKATTCAAQDGTGVAMLPDRLPRSIATGGFALGEGGRRIEDGLTDFARVTRSRATCLCDPRVLLHSRWEDSCCWPKVRPPAGPLTPLPPSRPDSSTPPGTDTSGATDQGVRRRSGL